MTGLGKQAKRLSDIQLRTLLRHVEGETGFPERNRVIVLMAFQGWTSQQGNRGRSLADGY